jgi:N-acetylmuramoyl-L-alanine amidase
MFTFSYRNAESDYLLIHPWDWGGRSQAASSFRGYEVLDLWEAARVFDELAADRHARELLHRLAPKVLLGFHAPSSPPGSYQHEQEEAWMIERLRDEALGSIFSKRGQPPDFAGVYICRRKRVERARTPLPDPWQDVHEAIEAAERGPRGFVSVQTITEAGDAVPHVRLEVVLANGEVVRCSTDAQGQVRLEAIPQGRCTIRVPEIDGGTWAPAAGEASSQIEHGHNKLHIVQRGENLTRIAQHYGIKGWRKLWDAPDNAKLREKRRNPHALWPGDELIVPAIAVHQVTRPTDLSHSLVFSEELVDFRVVLQDHNQQPFADEPYELRVDTDASAPRRGTTDSAGKVVEGVCSAAEQLEVALPEIGLCWRFLLSDFVERPSDEAQVRAGHEDALAQAVKATQLRLNALGFPCGEADGRMGTKTCEALALAGQPAERSQAETIGDRALAALDHVEPLFTRNA